jgi:hypothetical protein
MRGPVITGLVALAAIAGPAAASATTPEVYSPQNPPQLAYVCNEAQSSWKGQSYVSSDDPNPPARRNNSSRNMPVGRGNGLVGAAANSPALALCGGGEETPQ